MNFYIFFLIKTSNHADVIIFRNEKYFVAKKNGRINSYSRNEKEWLLVLNVLYFQFFSQRFFLGNGALILNYIRHDKINIY